MLERRTFTETYCPKELDGLNPYNYRRKRYVLDYPQEISPVDYPSANDGDIYKLISMIFLTDKQVDNYSIGIYCRLKVIEHFKRDWKEIYQYGNKDYIDKALEKLQNTGYITIKDEELTINFI